MKDRSKNLSYKKIWMKLSDWILQLSKKQVQIMTKIHRGFYEIIHFIGGLILLIYLKWANFLVYLLSK